MGSTSAYSARVKVNIVHVLGKLVTLQCSLLIWDVRGFQGLVTSLKQAQEQEEKLVILQELIDIIAISTEEQMPAFSVDTLIPLLVRNPILGVLLTLR